MTDTHQLPSLPTLQPGDSHMESLIEAAIQGHADTREAMRWLVRQLVPATQSSDVTDEQIESCALEAGFSVESTGAIWAVDGFVGTRVDPGLRKFARAILALRPVQVPMTMTQVNAAWDGLMPSGCGKSRYDITRLIEAHHGITALAKKEGV